MRSGPLFFSPPLAPPALHPLRVPLCGAVREEFYCWPCANVETLHIVVAFFWKIGEPEGKETSYRMVIGGLWQAILGPIALLRSSDTVLAPESRSYELRWGCRGSLTQE